MIHADPDPDDVLVLADGRLAILDFGATRTVDPERVKTAAAALEAFASEDEQALARRASADSAGCRPRTRRRQPSLLAMRSVSSPGPIR